MVQTHYENLNVKINATMQEVKNAYIMSIRQYPAEVHPDKFREIQAAYNVLKNEKQRATYDLEIIHGDEIGKLREVAFDSYEQQDYDNAKYYYEKVLALDPKNTSVMNDIALCYLEMSDNQSAIQMLKKAIIMDDTNGTYYYNLATAYQDEDSHQLAIRNYKQALLWKPNNYNYIESLALLYERLGDIDNACNIVEVSLNKQPKENEHMRFLYIKLLVRLAAVNHARFELKVSMKYLTKLVEQTKYEHDMIFLEMGELCRLLTRKCYFDAAQQIINWMKSADKYSEYKELWNSLNENYNLLYEFEVLYKNEDILFVVRYKAYLYLNGEYMDDYEDRIETLNEMVIDASTYEKEALRSSIEQVKRLYPIIYRELNDWFMKVKRFV